MKFPVDLLADVSQTELEHLAHNCMNNLLYSNPDSPERLTLSDSTQVTIDISSVGFVPLYGSSDKQKILALFSPSDPFTAVALYLLDQWWAVDDILKTADPARHGAVEVETVGERIVLYILNRVIYRAKEMSSDELPFLCHGEKDHAKILWNNGEAVGFYSVKPSGSLCNSFSTRSYQLPVMDSIFVRKCQRGKGFGLQMLEDFVLSFKEDCLGLRYPLSPSMYKVCEKYLCQYPGDTGLLWEVEGIGGPNQRTNVASRIQAMEQSAVSKNLSFTEESLVITQMTEKGVAMEAVTTQIKDADSVECTVEIVEEVTVLSATIVPLTARGRSSGSKRRKTGEKIAEDKPEKVLRIEDIEAETPRGEQVSAQQETELHNVSELVQTEGMISVAPEGQGEDAVDTVPGETVRVLDQPATVLAPQDLEEADVTLAPMTEEPQVENDTPQDLTNTSRGSQITVENVASEIEEAGKEYQNEDTAVLVVSEEVLEVHKGAETLDKVGEKTQIGDTGEKLEKKVTQHEVSLLTYATSEDGEAGRTGKTRRTVVKAIKTVQSETPRRRSKRQHKLQEGLKEESTVQGGDLILRGRTVTKTPTPKRKNPCCSQKVSEELEKEANEVADENEVSITDVVEESAVIEREQEEMTSVKRDVVNVEELTEEKQQPKDEQLANEREAKKQHQPGVEDTVVKGCSTELPNIAETALTKENEDEKVTDESQKIQKGEKVETSVIGDKQDVSDDEIQEPPVAQKRALTGRLKVTPKPQPTRQSKRHQQQKAEHIDEADLETGGSAGEEKADEQPTDKQMDEHHKDEQEETADKTEEDISIEETTVLKKSQIPQTEKTAEDVIPSTEVNVEGTKEVQEMEETEGEAEKEKESVSVFRKGGCSAAATARLKIAHTQCQTEEGEEETEEIEREEEGTGQELSEEKGEGVGEEEKSVEMEKDKDVEESLSDEEMSTQLAQAEENTQLEVEMEKLEAVAQESVTEQETVKEEQSAVSETCAEGQEVASVGESSEKTPNADKGMVTVKAEAPPVETVVRRSGEKTVRTTRSKTTKRQDDEQKQSAVKKSTEEGELAVLAVETRFFRRGRRSAAATAKHKSKRACTQCQTEGEGEEESRPAEETGREEGETWQKLPKEKREKVEEEEESVEMEKDKDVEDEVESTAGEEFAIGDAKQMKDASTEEAAVLEEEDNSDKDVDEITTDTVQISPAEVGETNSAEEEETMVLEKPTVAPDVGSDTAIVTGVAGDVIQEPDTVAATLEAVIPDIALGEADASAAGEPQEKDIGSEIPKLQKATIILVDIKTSCHHLSVKEAEETPVARVHAASENQQEEENGDKQENIKEKSVEATVETETSKKEELEEDNSEKEKDESADVDEEMRKAEEALITEKQTVESSCESTSRSDQQKEEDNTGEGITKNEMDEVETGTDEVEEEMESVDKDAVIVIVPVEKKQSAVSEICREADISTGDDAEENLPPAEVDKAMSSEEEEEEEEEEAASVIETRALKRQTKPSKATPKRKSTRRRKQGDAQEEDNNNREEQLAVTTRTLRSGRISASDTQKGKSRRSCKQIQEGGQNVEEKTQSVNKTRVEEDEAVEPPAIEKIDKEMEDKDETVEKFEEEAATERVEDLEPEIDMEDGKAVAMQAQDGVEEQLESIFKTFAEKEVEASGEECDERKPAMGCEEMELLPDAVTRSLRSGQKMSKASPKNKSRQSKKQQDEMKEGGASAEKSTDGNEPPAETRILRGERKSVCGIHKQLKKEEDGLKESGEEAGVVEEEEARLGSVKEPPTEADEGKVPDEDKTEMENEEFVPVEVRKVVSEEGTMEITEDEENTAGDAADADELVQGETDTPLPELATDSAVLSPSKEEATHSVEDQQSEEMAPKLSDLQRLTVVLVDVQKKHHDIKEVTAAARLGGSVQKTATNAEEEQKEERAAEEKVTGFPLGTEKNELEKVIVDEEEFQDDVEAVTTKDTGEGIAEETAKEEEAKSINDEQEPIITETKTCRSKKQAVKATPSTKLARSRQKKGELAKKASTIQKVQTVQTVQIRVLRRGRMFRPVTQKCATKRTHKQLQEREEVEGGEKSTAVEERVEEEKQQQVIDQEKKEKLKKRDVTEQVEHIEAEMGMDKENTLAEEAVIQQEEEQVNSTETAGNEETGASAGLHADEGKAPDVAEEAVPTQDTVEGEQLTSASKEVESASGVSTQETLLTAKDDKANNVSEKEKATVTERVLRSGEKTVRDTRHKTTKRQKDEQEETAVEKSTEEDELAVETRILRKGGRSAAATARQKSKRARTQCQTEEEGEEETPPAEETGGEKEETRQGLPKEKGEEVEEEEKSVEMEKEKDEEDEEVESAAGEEFAIGDAEQMKDASTEEAAVLEEEDKSDKDVDDISTHTIQISSAEVEETNSSEEEKTTVIEKVTDATEVGSDTALTEEEELVGSASVVPEEAPAITTRGLRSKIKTLSATSSRRSKRQKDQEVVETQQQEEDPEEEQDHEVTNDSPPRSVRKRPRVDSSEKGEADEQRETEAATEEQSDDNKDNKKAKSYADEPKEKLDNLDRDREVETAGISQKDVDNEQNMSKEELEPIVIGNRVLRRRSVSSVIVTPQPKSRRCSAKVQTAEESLSDEEENAQFAQKRKSTEVTATRKSKRLSRD